MTKRDKERRRMRRKAERQSILRNHEDMQAVKRMNNKKKQMRRDGHDVHLDHIIPIRHALVCGLTCTANLQIISAKEDHAKGNDFKPFRKSADGTITYY